MPFFRTQEPVLKSKSSILSSFQYRLVEKLKDMSTNEKRFYPFKIPSSSSSISDVYVSELGRLYVAAGGLFEIKEGLIIKPDFMSPLITSDGIKSIVKSVRYHK